MKPYTTDVLERAWRELAWENANWNLSLPRATPDRLLGLFDEGIELLANDPQIGAEDEEHPGYRRLLRRTGRVGFWMYYRVDHASELVQVVSLWSTQREPSSDL